MSIPSRIFFTVILFLGVALILCLGGAVLLTVNGDPIPDMLKEFGVGALTGLTGMLAQHEPASPTPVVVQQPAGQPVPVDTTPPISDGPTFPDGGHAELHGVLAMAAAILLALTVWSLLGAHTDLFRPW